MDECKNWLSKEKAINKWNFHNEKKNNKGAKSITCAEKKTLIASIHFTSII